MSVTCYDHRLPNVDDLDHNFLINFLKPSDKFTYHQVLTLKILRGAHIAFMCFVRISEQTATFAL
jgi:hypothetical protein